MTTTSGQKGFSQPVVLGRKHIQGSFVIPSGIRCTKASTIELCFAENPEVGVVTTKSISRAPRAGYHEPIYARYAPDSYINAVGLSNPGAEQFRKELEAIRIPENKFLLVSIFGGNLAQFVETARELMGVADGFELNMSCPHAEGYGVEIGQNRDLVAEITKAVVDLTRLPVIVKLSAIVGDVGATAKASIAAGAAGITVTNTIGPATVNIGDIPILSNRVGGLSGVGIRPLGLRAVKRVREAIGPEPIIIGMGGISTAEDVLQFQAAGANLFGIGSALTGMDTTEAKQYFRSLGFALGGPRLRAESGLPGKVSMEYFPATVVARQEYHSDLFKLVLDKLPISGQYGELGGKYFFLFIPGVGEKPFAIFCAEEKSIVVRVAGRFTRYLKEVAPGTPVFLRGPYGRSYPLLHERNVLLVGGGTGIASLLEIAKRLAGQNQLHFALGGRSANDLFDLEKFSKLGTLELATNDGSKGHRGFVTDLVKVWLNRGLPNATYVFCGPEPMVEAGFALLKGMVAPENLWGAIEYTTSCGVGICGKCASPSGLLTCIDGPFMPVQWFSSNSQRS
jgi:dihydroorotate dehydrogenase (NAD+) catalytic subunit